MGRQPAICRSVLKNSGKDTPAASGAFNRGRSVGGERGYGERHGDAMIARRIDLRGMKILAAGDVEAVRRGLDLDAHPPEIGLDAWRCGRFP